ncbi:MAG: hypothetical protein QXU18_03625 [Thermoplasmatales archaeon]
MTISRVSDILSYLQAVSIKIEEGKIVKSTESENPRSLLKKLKIPYLGNVIENSHLNRYN